MQRRTINAFRTVARLIGRILEAHVPVGEASGVRMN
jgi:hypothetical protein